MEVPSTLVFANAVDTLVDFCLKRLDAASYTIRADPFIPVGRSRRFAMRSGIYDITIGFDFDAFRWRVLRTDAPSKALDFESVHAMAHAIITTHFTMKQLKEHTLSV